MKIANGNLRGDRGSRNVRGDRGSGSVIVMWHKWHLQLLHTCGICFTILFFQPKL